MNFQQLYYLLSIDAIFIILIVLTRFECIQQQFIKFQSNTYNNLEKRKQRKSQTKPALFSPGASFFHHHHSLDPDANTDEQRQVRRKSRATTLKLSQTTNSQNEQARQPQVRKSMKNHTTLTIISSNSNQQTTPESNKHRNTIRKQSQFVTQLLAPQTARNIFNTNQSDHGSRAALSRVNDQTDNKKMNPCFLYFPLIKGFIQLTHNQPLILIQCWERLILQLVYADLMVFYEFVFIPVFFIAHRLIHKIIRRIANNNSDRFVFIASGVHFFIIIGGQIVYIIFAKFNFLTIIINCIDIIAIDLLIYCIFRLYRVSEGKQEQEQID